MPMDHPQSKTMLPFVFALLSVPIPSPLMTTPPPTPRKSESVMESEHPALPPGSWWDMGRPAPPPLRANQSSRGGASAIKYVLN